MKNFVLLFVMAGLLAVSSCKDDESDRFKFLTGTTWVPVSLLANGADATGEGGLLEDFAGEANFNTDGTGTLGSFSGTWRFEQGEEKLIISSPDLPISVTLNITELTASSLKLEGSLPDPANWANPFINIEMTFRAK